MMRGRRLTTGGVLATLPTLLLVLLGGAVGSSCLDPTEVMLTITTDIPCAVDGSGTYAPTKTFVDLADVDGQWDTVASRSVCASRVGSLALLPGGRDEVRFAVRGEVTDDLGGTHEVVATRRVRFVSHQKLPISVRLSASCLDVTCPDPATQTCQDGVCVGNIEAPDGGLALDGGFIPDGTRKDGPGDVLVNPKDVIAELIGPDDSGICQQLQVGAATLWSFNEGVGNVTLNSDNIPTTLDLIAGVNFTQDGVCKSGLSVPANTLQKIMPSTGTGNTSFGAAFFVKAPIAAFNGAPFLSRGAPQTSPSWSIGLLANGRVELTLNIQGAPYKFSSGTAITPGTYAAVVVLVAPNSGAIRIDSTLATQFVPPVGAADAVNAYTVVAGPIILDELQLRLK
jgi:hypothetical protein